MSESMHTFTIYRTPADYPTVPFVVRGWLIGPGGQLAATGEVAFADSLEQARTYVPPGMVRFERDEGDEAQIVETWL